ncbi:GtrA family protein [Rhizobium sp. BK068]|uniref:GtrA family protein n=1 Tax=Rhizobium sp. BK068 TaxID=2512130 RepID=UPI00104B997A|nr:GtrA family protein [Rhizobium sp. BK068]TCM60247.1 putative flippase GtrA [Rhizobium sp. BK068]
MRVTLKDQVSRYALVGILNTSIGLLVIYVAMSFGIGDLTSNIAGYAIGFAVSYCLNTTWTFQARPNRENAAKYAFLIAVSYLMNVVIVFASRDLIGLNRYVAQLTGVGAYTVLSFAGSRLFVFR